MQAVFPNQTEFRRMCRHMLFLKNGFPYTSRLQAVGKNAYHKQDRNIDHHSQAACVPVRPWAAAGGTGAAVKGLLIMHISIQTFAKITVILIIAHNNSLAFFIFLRVFLFLALLYAMTSLIKLPYKDKTILLNNRFCKIYCLKK